MKKCASAIMNDMADFNYQQNNMMSHYLDGKKKSWDSGFESAADLHVQKIRTYCQIWTVRGYGQ